MQLVVTEKPSVAQAISHVIGAKERKDGYMEGNGFLVSWCVGHLGALLIETNANRLSNRGYFTISGITVVDSPNWTLSVYNTDHVMIDNINILCWILNGDGIDLCSVTDATKRMLSSSASKVIP